MKTEEVYKLVEDIRKEAKADYLSLEAKADKIYVKIEAFEPVRKLVYGMVAVILSTVILALVSLLLK